jgi:transcriptional regulator with XRE-family HTH domain
MGVPGVKPRAAAARRVARPCVERRPDGKGEGVIERESERFAAVAGDVLRQVRQGRRLSLRQVTVRSGGRFKPSSVASYERGERNISLERLFALAEVYGVAPERIVAAIAHELAPDEVASRRPGRPDVEVLEPFAVGTQNRR